MGDSTSDNSEKLFQRGGEDSICVILVKRGYMQSSRFISWKASAGLIKFLLVMRNSSHHEGFLCFSRYEVNWAHKIRS